MEIGGGGNQRELCENLSIVSPQWWNRKWGKTVSQNFASGEFVCNRWGKWKENEREFHFYYKFKLHSTVFTTFNLLSAFARTLTLTVDVMLLQYHDRGCGLRDRLGQDQNEEFWRGPQHHNPAARVGEQSQCSTTSWKSWQVSIQLLSSGFVVPH